jgi:vanillate O-demethylase monooxygenase subunit
MGRLVDDTIECGYHGLRFSGAGSCVYNPHDAKISSRARVPVYPLVERDTLLWIWMGDPALANDKTIPDLSDRLSSNTFRAVHGTMKVGANYQLLTDNLLDHSHGQFLHAKFLKFDGFFSVPLVSSQQGTTVVGDRHYRGVPGQPQFVKHLPGYNGTVDAWSVGRWMPPSICLQDIGVTNAGDSGDDGIRRLGIHLLTPESESSTHYFFAAVRNHGLDDSDLDRDSYAWFQAGLTEQDNPMLEAVQRMMDGRTLEELRPVLLSSDGPAMRARKILRELIREEEGVGQVS